MTALPPPAARVSLQGHYAGFASRFAAYVIDAAVTTGVFTLGLAALSYVVRVLTGHTVSWHKDGLAAGITFLAWEFVYYAYCWGTSGRTVGMAILGLRVVHRSGAPLSQARAIVRTLAFPFSFLFLGLGFTGIVFQSERRALHDLVAGSAVVYDWDARAARLRFLARHGGGQPSAAHLVSRADHDPAWRRSAVITTRYRSDTFRNSATGRSDDHRPETSEQGTPADGPAGNASKR